MTALNGIIFFAVVSFLAFLLALALGRLRRRRAARAGFAPRRLGVRYQLIERIGEGGMGTVYRGWDEVLRRPLAVKRLRDELQDNLLQRGRFLQEAELVAALHHPGIVEIHDIVLDATGVHLVFEYVPGQTLHALLNASPGRHLPPARALEILGQIAEAVDYAHSRLVIHRDLKPANVMIDAHGRAKVMDFGIARQVEDSLLKIKTKTIVGTPTHMAPEQELGEAAPQSDVYSLGIILYEMLTGGLPYKGPDELRDKMAGRFLSASALLPTLPASIDAVMAKALAPRPEQRFRRCGELFSAAASALHPRAASAPF